MSFSDNSQAHKLMKNSLNHTDWNIFSLFFMCFGWADFRMLPVEATGSIKKVNGESAGRIFGCYPLRQRVALGRFGNLKIELLPVEATGSILRVNG